MPGHARGGHVPLRAQPPDSQGRVRAGQTVGEVVDLLVGLGDDHDRPAGGCECTRRPDDQRGLAGAGRRVDDDRAVAGGQVRDDLVGGAGGQRSSGGGDVGNAKGEHDAHAAVLTEGPAEVLTAVPQDVRNTTEMRNAGASLDWATAWLRVTPQRLFSFAEHAWQDVSGSSSAH